MSFDASRWVREFRNTHEHILHCSENQIDKQVRRIEDLTKFCEDEAPMCVTVWDVIDQNAKARNRVGPARGTMGCRLQPAYVVC